MNAQVLEARLSDISILVLGDLMLDKYLFGKVNRISPEAPVPVVEVYHEESRLGGAANVALNLQALGVKPVLVGIIGQDNNGEEFLHLLNKHQIDNQWTLHSKNRRTTTKFRIIGNQQQVLRVDKEDTFPISDEETQLILEKIHPLLQKQQVQAIIFEDYDKGVISPILIEKIIQWSHAYNIPTFVDPKFKNFSHYSGCTVFKPNLKELRAGLKGRFEWNTLEELIAIAPSIQQHLKTSHLVLTLSEQGILCVTQNKTQHFPAYYRQIADVSGAGDTVVSTLAATMTAGIDFFTASQLANLAGGLVCEKVGVVPINKQEWLQEALNSNLIAP